MGKDPTEFEDLQLVLDKVNLHGVWDWKDCRNMCSKTLTYFNCALGEACVDQALEDWWMERSRPMVFAPQLRGLGGRPKLAEESLESPVYADLCFSRGAAWGISALLFRNKQQFPPLMACFHRAVGCFNGRQKLLKTLGLGRDLTIPEGISRRGEGRTVETAVKNSRDTRNVEQ